MTPGFRISKAIRAKIPIAAIAMVLISAQTLPAQTPVTIPGTEQFLIKSTGNGVEYRVDVALPPGYSGSKARYPVFYLLDSNLEFANFVATARQLSIFGLGTSIPPVILVGIGYKEDDPAVYTPFYGASRTRDYTPTEDKSAAFVPTGSGHGPEFLRFIKEELIPAIDARYRTDPADRGLGGHSFGGLFTTYALLHEPGLFNRYWLGSPSLWWDSKISFSWLEPASRREAKPHGRAYLTVGRFETSLMVSPMERMASELRTRFTDLEVGSVVFEDEDHMSTLGGSISRALRFLYGRWGHPAFPISRTDLLSYSGKWKSSSGETISITPLDKKLLLTLLLYGDSVTVELLAERKDYLYDNSLGFKFVAEREGSGRVVRLHRKMGEGDVIFEKLP
jgi:predicted alpha/beta superfamily hydrolase